MNEKNPLISDLHQDVPHVLSLGAGVQSSCMALMAEEGLILPKPIAAIFADTMAEPRNVYEWLDWLEKKLSFPVIRVCKGDLGRSALDMKKTHDGRVYSRTNIPFFTRNHDGTEGKIRMRACTKDYKLLPIRKKQRELCNIKRGQKTVGCVTWIGISADEIYRMKESREAWCLNRWPLVELGMHRQDCLTWMEKRGYPKPPRSACVFCPYHNDHEWRRLKNENPEDFQRAVQFEKDLQHGKRISNNFRTTPFLHRQLVPLDQVDLSTEEDNGQMNMFNQECEGMCGV